VASELVGERGQEALAHADHRYWGDTGLTGGSDCYKKPPSNSPVVGGLEVGISGVAEIMERAL
jgi:hypothetical protein